MMNLLDRLSNIWTTIITVAFCSIFVFTACKKDELDTNLLKSKETTLVAYGPNPALRGQKLSFAGTHLDKITKVILPEGIEITDIEKVSDKLIKVVIPQETVDGVVKLIGPNNLEITVKDELTISEPISITKMSPQPVKAGQLLTIEGDYFNFMDKIIFTDKVEVLKGDCQSWSRTKIEVILPAEAAPGVITLVDNAEIPLEYQSPDPLQVVLPSVNAVLDLTGNKPGDAISAPGRDLDLVVSVEMPNGNEVEFTIESNTLQFTLPGNISDGAIVMIPASGVRVVVGNIGVAMPAEIVVTPGSGLRADDVITISGINMELVTTVKFPNVSAAVTPDTKSATEITVKMPAMAITGEIVLNTASGKTVTAEIETLKPEVLAYNPFPAQAGMDVKLQGSNLDLVVSVTFVEKLVVTVTPGAANELTIGVPLDAVTGVVVLTMANGETVECEELEISVPTFAYLPNPPGPKAEIFAGEIFAVEVDNGDKLTDVQVNGVSVNYILYAPNMYIAIPVTAKGNTELKLVSSNGVASYTIPVIGAGLVETVIWEDLWALQWGACLELDGNLFDNVPVGARLKVYMATTDDEVNLAFLTGNWGGPIPTGHEFSKPDNVLGIPEGTTSLEIVLTKEIFDIMKDRTDMWNNTWIMLQGSGAIISKVSILTGNEPEQLELWKGSVGPIGWSGSDYVPVDVNQLIPGKVLGIEFEVDPGGGQMEVMGGSWWEALPSWEALNGGERYIRDCAASDTYIEFTISQADIDCISMQGDALLICGGGVTIKRLYLVL